jgi:L-2-hydroxycarboxylate dehydrogenase (NAD+)
VAYLPLLSQSVGKGLGHFFGAIRIDAFRPADEFKKSMDQWIETFRNAQSVNSEHEVIIPGDPERIHEQLAKSSGISLLPHVIEELNGVATKLNLSVLM